MAGKTPPGDPDAAAARTGTGTLYVVATPIGNLEDLTRRAARVLGEVALILAEDTRITRKLLSHLGLHTPLRSFHEHAERERTPAVLEALARGQSVALVCDAGTPCLSDPGLHLVRAAAAQGVRVTPVPGPSALLAVLSVAGLPTDRFTFLGFFPRRERDARALLSARPAGTLVIFESPHRLKVTLDLLAEVLPDAPLCVARELTKVHEELLWGTVSDVRAALAGREVKGEIVLVLGDAGSDVKPRREELDLADAYAKEIAAGRSRTEAMRAIARRAGLPRREVYRRLLALRTSEVI